MISCIVKLSVKPLGPSAIYYVEFLRSIGLRKYGYMSLFSWKFLLVKFEQLCCLEDAKSSVTDDVATVSEAVNEGR